MTNSRKQQVYFHLLPEDQKRACVFLINLYSYIIQNNAQFHIVSIISEELEGCGAKT